MSIERIAVRDALLAIAWLSLALLVVDVSLAAAQESTASIIGQIADESGAVLAGVTATATSPALQVPQITGVTDEKGEYRLTLLPIGTYSVRYELVGFQPVQRDGVRLTTGFVAKMDLVMKLGTVAESVTVSGQVPVVDVTSTTPRTVFVREALEELPTTRNSMVSLLIQAPGVRTSASAFDVGGNQFTGAPAFNSFGRTGDSWQMVEGVFTSSPSGTAQGNYFDFASFEEAQIQTVGNNAEMPATGVWLNTILKSGGNDFHGSGYYALTGPWAQTSNIDDALRAVGVTGGNKLISRRDVSGDLGGRILRNKLWFYGGGRAPKDDQEILGAFKPDGSVGDSIKIQGFYTGKLSYQMTPTQKFTAFHQWNKKLIPNNNLSQFVPWESRVKQDQTGYVDKVGWTGVFGNNVVAEAQYGYFTWLAHARGYDYGQVATFDVGTLKYTGDQISSWPVPLDALEWRHHVRASLSWFKPDFFHGNHEFKGGFDYAPTTKNWAYAARGASQDYALVFRNGAPFEIFTFNNPVNPFNSASYSGAYVHDRWLMGRLTLDLGIRFDRNNVFLPAQSREQGSFAARATYPEVDFNLWTAFAPRIHFAYDLRGNAKTVIKGGWGRFDSMRFTTDGEPVNANAKTQTTYLWHDVNGDRIYEPGEVNLSPSGTDFVSQRVGESPGPVRVVNPNEAGPKLDEFSLNLEHELIPDLALRVTGVYARQFNLRRLQWLSRPYSSYNIPVTVRDPGPDGRVGTADDPGTFVTYYEYPAALQGAAFATTTPINDSNFVDTWTSFEVAVTKRSSKGWQMLGSFSATKKNLPFRAEFAEYTPNAEIFAADRTWQWFAKLAGSYRFRWGMLAAANFQAVNGEQYQRTVLVSGGKQIPSFVVPVEPWGARQYPSTYLVDLRVEKTLALPHHNKLSVRADLFNSLNANTVIGVSTQSGATFGVPTAILPSRIVVFGFSYTF